MNKFFSNLERKIGRYAIKNLTLGLILCYAAGYVIQLLNSEFFYYLYLSPYHILHGQVWRLISWVLIPPGGLDIFTLIMLFFYFSIGVSLERTWGEFQYNLYIFGGLLFTILGSFILYAVTRNPLSTAAFSTYYVNMSIFLAYAVTFSEARVLLMFVIPIKVKYLGWAYGAILIYQFYASGIADRIVIGASLLNFILFILLTRDMRRLSPTEMMRRAAFKRSVQQRNAAANQQPGSQRESRSGNIHVVPQSRNVLHRCAICGRTEADSPQLEFRFCSKCEGNFEYCSDHLYTHVHVRKDDTYRD